MTPARILVAEDDPITRKFVATLMTQQGFEVIEAEDGEHALELVEAHRPDLVITDLVMPYRDGFGLVRSLRENDAFAKTPVIILSMRDREEDIVRGFDEGCDDYVIKPFNARELVARVRKLLERAAAS